MTSLKVLLVGDVHFPEVKSALGNADYNDKAFPLGLAELSVPDRLANVVREIAAIRQSYEEVAAILICGDLTSKGDLAGYKECVAYLNNVLQISDPSAWSDEEVHIVPGNHDVDRKLCGSAKSIYDKFEPLESAWAGPPGRILTTRTIRQTSIANDKSGIELFSLNSCVGCGETRSLPKKIREELGKILSANADAFELVGEQLDTPAFVEKDVTELTEAIRHLSASQFPIVLGHHNILPQATPRIDLYTEIINGGLVRSRLLHCGRPVIYCHGHIHTDPIEIIESPTDCDGGPVISLCVPPLKDGFDLIELHFGSTSQAIGCTVHRFRMQNDGGLLNVERQTTRINLQRKDCSSLVPGKFSTIAEKLTFAEYVRFSSVHKAVRKKITSLSKKQLADILLEAEWLGFIDILNRASDPKHWNIRKLQP